MRSIKYYVEETEKLLLNSDFEFNQEILKNRFFIGNGNAYQVGKYYANRLYGLPVDFAYFERIKDFFNDPKICVVSASGGKDSILPCKYFNDVVLLTCNKKAPSKEFAKETIIFPALEEPQFYNVSTYSSMIYHLEPQKINFYEDQNLLELLNKNENIIFVGDKKTYPIACMCALKVREILGKLSIGLHEIEAKHGYFLHDKDNECVIILNSTFNLKQDYFLKNNSLSLLLHVYYNIGFLQEVNFFRK